MRRLGDTCLYEVLDEIIPASNVFACLIADSFGEGGIMFVFSFLCRFRAARPRPPCDEAGLPMLWDFWIPFQHCFLLYYILASFPFF